MKSELSKKQSGGAVKFSSHIGFILATAGSAVGLGNIWRFPYLAAKYGGGAFLLVYIILAVTFGSAMIISEMSLGRMTGKSPVGAFEHFGTKPGFKLGGWLNAIIPMIIMPYYCAIGGWVIRYMVGFMAGTDKAMAKDSFFGSFISNSGSAEIWFLLFAACTIAVVAFGVNSGIERISTVMMPALLVLAIIIMIYSVTRPGAMAGVKYTLIPEFENFSLMTVVTAMGQMFYSLSIAMGILYTYGSYMKRDSNIETSAWQLELFDTAIALLATLMIIPGVFAFGDPSQLQAGPSLMFITMPKIFGSMGIGRVIGALFFIMVFFAALTSSISLMEPGVATIVQQFKTKRSTAVIIVAAELILVGTASALGYGVWSNVKIGGMQILDFLDFLSNSVMMPIAAIATCVLVAVIGVNKISKEVKISSKFIQEKLYSVVIRFVAPVLLAIIFISSVLNAIGIIHM